MTEQNKEPTKAQQERFWKGWGLTFFRDQWWFGKWGDAEHYYGKKPLPIDLNSLFQFAVPIALKKIGNHKLAALVSNALCDAIEAGEKLDYFLFWALWQVMEAK